MSRAAAVPLSGLDRVMVHTHAAMKQAKLAAFYAGKADADQSREAALYAAEEAGRAVSTLQMMGAVLPNVPAAAPVPLSLLSTPSSRALLETLREAVSLAERVDAERGRSTGEPLPGDVAGLDLAEVLHEVFLRVSDEVNGPVGRE